MSYTRVNWQNKPSTATPINATNLNTMDAGIAALDTALDDKVDKVAGYGLSENDFSDAYKDKVDGIEAGAEVNVQADWDEADNTADNYIKNKPDLSVYAEKDELWSDATLSGNPVTLKTQTAQAAKSTILTMNPVQDLHGYSKPWAPGASEQMLDESTAEQGTINQTTGADESSNNVKRSDFMPINGATNLYLGAINSSRFFWYDSSKTYLSNDACQKNASVAIPNGTAYFRMISVNETWTSHIMVNAGTTAKTYCPYANVCPITGRTQAEIVVKDEDDVTQDTVTISFGQTVYGGTLDVETGALSVEWAYIASYNGETITEPWISDRDEYVPNTSPSTGAEVAYKLASPTTTTLTAAQVNLIKGLNNISTDADGLSITYFADGESLTDADNRITAVLGDFAMVEGARASQNYAIGDYLIFSDKFCKASAAIASGEVLAIGTNLTQTTVGAELKAILAQL